MNIHCQICNEPWDDYGLRHGDVAAWEADMIRAGNGCPCCMDNGFTIPDEYTKPEPLVVFNCTDCGETITVDQDEIRYYDKDLAFDEPPQYLTEDGVVCEDCYCDYSECADCGATVHNNNSIYIQHLMKSVCYACIENYSSCDQCGQLEENMTVVENECFCKSCASSKVADCVECDKTIPIDEGILGADNEFYCSMECYDKAKEI